MSLSLQAPCIDQLHLYVGREIVSQVRISDVYSVPDANSAFMTEFEIDDASGFIRGKMGPHRITLDRAYSCPFDAFVQGLIVQAGTVLEWQIMRLEPLEPRHVRCASAMLRQRWCPEPARKSLLAMVNFEKSLKGALRTFMREVIQDPEVGENFLTCRASDKHHHSYSGGLLVQSTDLLEQAKAFARQLPPREPLAAEVAQLGYLLHDLGKLRSVGAQERACPDNPLRHPVSTLTILDPHLHALQHNDPDAAAGLRRIFDALATPRDQTLALAQAQVVRPCRATSANVANNRISIIEKRHAQKY